MPVTGEISSRRAALSPEKVWRSFPAAADCPVFVKRGSRLDTSADSVRHRAFELASRFIEDGPVGPSEQNNRRISFRPIGRSDFHLLQKWLAASHVAVWWNEHFDLASLESKYGPGIDGSAPIYVYLINFDGTPIGWIQWYRWRDFPKHAIQLGADSRSAGIDLAIGEVEMTGRGLGPAVIQEFGTNYIFTNKDLSAIVADPAVSNLISVAAFKRAGFNLVRTVQLVDEAFARHVVQLERGEN